MKQTITLTETGSQTEWLYAPNHVYYSDDACQRHLQIIFPYRQDMPGSETYPLVLFIPGSAWHKQEMYNDIPKLAKLAQRGFVVAAMEYRESDIAPFPAQVEDVSNALAALADVAEPFHMDMERIFLMGNSSGGHIAMIAMLMNAHGLCQPLPGLRGVICESGSTDLLLCAQAPLPPWMKVRPSAALLGVDCIEGHEEEARRASCAMYVTKDVALPPVLLIHSEHDPVVSVENSRSLHDCLAAAGHDVTYIELADCHAHGGATFFSAQVLDMVQGFCERND